ncbi:deleted in malignant brain tumors 1 protein-like isoform X4 [Mugil cephalus]|uniref:deleted in malignant brain tumors 1 protein-like isoform X4 n=1 Tax=Mugil cephalus TaxID=48193 RepID=UPI001FB6B7F7|nr:deleted in malignant brain tumors 1 protein-like isoform X4 [Mugil cephalus]
MWTLLFLCSVLITHGPQGAVSGYDPEATSITVAPEATTTTVAPGTMTTTVAPQVTTTTVVPEATTTTVAPEVTTPTVAPEATTTTVAPQVTTTTVAPEATTTTVAPQVTTTTVAPEVTTTTVAPEATTTTVPSCRYNCGSYPGNCSCSYYCLYYGNCCPDAAYYCSLATTAPPTTTAPSCRYNCGYYLGNCSCSSSCQYYGNCCPDFEAYCSVTTYPPNTAAPCGGSLFSSGTFSSPYHPSYYQDNSYCVWYLRTTYDQRIFLTFTYLQLENCCNCDYISVYDGPYTSSPYLGKVCNGTMNTFHSSSNYMTVVFRTDISVVARGFKAEFFSTLTPSSGQVDCSSDYMTIVLKNSYLNSLGYNGNSLYLNDPYCRPQISSYQVVFKFPINSCGNVKGFHNGKVVYTNALRASDNTSGEITRRSYFKMNVSCLMEQDSVSQIMYVVQHPGNSSIIGTGRFNTSMAFYTSSSYYYRVTQDPYEVALNQNLYVQVDLTVGDSSVVIFLDTCVASPSPYDFQTRRYYLVRNGCPIDNTYYSSVSGTRTYARFTFKAFQFLRASESVFLQCKVLICQASDYNSRCHRGCSSRVARDLASQHESQTLVLGPIKLKGPEKQEEGTNEQSKA